MKFSWTWASSFYSNCNFLNFLKPVNQLTCPMCFVDKQGKMSPSIYAYSYVLACSERNSKSELSRLDTNIKKSSQILGYRVHTRFKVGCVLDLLAGLLPWGQSTAGGCTLYDGQLWHPPTACALSGCPQARSNHSVWGRWQNTKILWWVALRHISFHL